VARVPPRRCRARQCTLEALIADHEAAAEMLEADAEGDTARLKYTKGEK